jgi:hypothetical protein
VPESVETAPAELNILPRLEWAVEAIGDGDQGAAIAVLLDLRDHLHGAVDQERGA